MSAPPRAIAFFDPVRQIHGTARSGATLLFRGRTPTALPEGPEIDEQGEALSARVGGSLDIMLEPLSEEVELAGVAVRVCRVAGEVEGARVDCLGTVSETRVPPSWEELDALRSISVLVDEENALLALARRPRGAPGHGHELVTAWLLQGGEPLGVEEARISTVYDGEGRQRSAGLELWLPGEELARRGSGTAVAGSSLELEGVTVHAAVFEWRLGEHEGVGAYEVMARRDEPAAA